MEETYWDPACETLVASSIVKSNVKLAEKIKAYSQTPGTILRKHLTIACIISLAVIICIIAFLSGFNFAELINTIIIYTPYIFLAALVVCLFTFFSFLSTKKQLERKSILFGLAQKNGWLANAVSDENHWRHLKKRFPDFFDEGDEDQCMYDEIWGTLQGRNFYLGTFRYTLVREEEVTTTDENGNQKTEIKKVHTVRTKHFVAAPLTGGSYFSLFNKKSTGKYSKKIQTESIEFNTMFSIQGPDVTSVIETLSPAIQMEFIELKNKINDYSLQCDTHCLIVNLHKESFLPRKIETNFWKNSSAHERDMQSVLDCILRFFETVDAVEKLWNC